MVGFWKPYLEHFIEYCSLREEEGRGGQNLLSNSFPIESSKIYTVFVKSSDVTMTWPVKVYYPPTMINWTWKVRMELSSSLYFHIQTWLLDIFLISKQAMWSVLNDVNNFLTNYDHSTFISGDQLITLTTLKKAGLWVLLNR